MIEALQREGHPIAVGTTGENLTLSGIEWPAIETGTELQIGEVRLHVTKYTTPCASSCESFLGGGIARISQKEHPGWCASATSSPTVEPADAFALTAGVGRRSAHEPSGDYRSVILGLGFFMLMWVIATG